jgi:hypothetical protein
MVKNDNTELNIFVNVYFLVYDICTKKLGYAFIIKDNSGCRVIQELSQCLYSVCFNNCINCYDCVLYEEMNTES